MTKFTNLSLNEIKDEINEYYRLHDFLYDEDKKVIGLIYRVDSILDKLPAMMYCSEFLRKRNLWHFEVKTKNLCSKTFYIAKKQYK